MPLPFQKRKMLQSQARELISKVYDFMKKEANEKYAEKLTDARWRTSQATGVSESTITRILKEKRTQSASSSGSTSPPRKKKVKPSKINIVDFNVGVIRITIQNFHIGSQKPTLNNLRNALKEKMLFDGCKSSLNRMLYSLGYRWHKTETRKKVLTEKHDMQWSRFSYLTQMQALRESGRLIVYTGESYIYTNNDQNKALVMKDSSIESQSSSMKGPGYIMVHAGSYLGFLSNALSLYNTDIKSGFNQEEMDPDCYLQWLETQLIPNLPKDAVVVMDDAAYHNTTTEKIPTMNTSKKEMQAWLTAKNIPYDNHFLRIELYDLIKKNKDKHKTYKVDEMLKAHNFTVLRLPTHHPELSPMKNIWGLVRNYVASYNDEQNNTGIIETLNKAFEDINKRWASECDHVVKIEDEYMKYFELDRTVMITDASDSESDNDDDKSEPTSSNVSDSDEEML